MKNVAIWLAAASALTMASAATADSMSVDQGASNKRFQEMGRMMDNVPQQRGAARSNTIRGHMRLLQEQMSDMRGPQGSRGGPMTGQNTPQGQPKTVPDAEHRMGSMEGRIDTMQRMMEQMLKQQELMLDDRTG